MPIYSSQLYDPPSLTLPEDVINRIYDNLKLRVDILGVMAYGSARKKERFIDVFLFEIAAHIGGIEIEIEKPLAGTSVPANGNVEYVINAGNKMIILLEAKSENFNEGRAQNFVECEVAYELNQDHQTHVYGIVTNSIMWYFNRLSGEDVLENFQCLSFGPESRYPLLESIKLVAANIAGIMDEMKSRA